MLLIRLIFIAWKDANITIPGVVKTSSTNTFNDVRPGISLSVKPQNDVANLAKILTITIKEYPVAAGTKIENFFTNYNKFI